MVVVVIAEHLAGPLLRLLPGPRPHVPREGGVVSQMPCGPDRFGLGGMRVRLQDGACLRPELFGDLLLEMGWSDRPASAEREGFIRGVSEQHRCVVELVLL